MLHQFKKLPSFNTVVAGSTATLDVPLGVTYHTFMLKYTRGGVNATEAQFKSDVKAIRLKIDGVTRWEATGAELVVVHNGFNGHAFAAGAVPIFLTASHRSRRFEPGDALAWGTRNVSTLTMEIDIDAAAVSPGLVARALSTIDGRSLDIIEEVRRFPWAAATGGEFEVPTLPRDVGNLSALHVSHVNITDARLRLNSVDVWEGDLTSINYLIAEMAGRVPQAGWVHIDPKGFTNRMDDVWPMGRDVVSDFRPTFTLSAADNGVIIMSTINAPLGVAVAKAA